MIEADKRRAIYLLHEEGMAAREIAQRFGLSRNTVRAIIAQQGAMPETERTDKLTIEPELLTKLYADCHGRIQRMHEKLVEEEGIQIKYSTLTRMLREAGISKPHKTRCHRVADEPGMEMQHDTTIYRVKLGSLRVKICASLIYMRYSKRRYLKFYRTFNRFNMKCFLHEALMFWGYSARQCIIDNTNLARLCGTGKNAVIVPEMVTFAQRYAFCFICHEKQHANRKAGEERSFWTVETNFLPGRSFGSLEDLNQQALEWSTVRMENRPQGKARLIPAKAFEHEAAYLVKLPSHLPAPYQTLPRIIDQYGYIAFGGNFYWVPGTKRGKVQILQYSDHLAIYEGRTCLMEYPLPGDGVRNAQLSPPGLPTSPYKPNNRKHPTDEEQRQLRAMAESVSGYLDFCLQTKGIQHHEFVRKLIALSRKVSSELFIKTIERAHKYRITDIETIRRIALLQLDQGALPLVNIDEQFTGRDTYREGSLTESPDLSIYDNLLNDNEDNDK